MTDRKHSDWISEFGDELRSGIRRGEQSRGRLRGRSVVIAVVALMTLPAAALGYAAWDDAPDEPSPSAGIVAEPGEQTSTNTNPDAQGTIVDSTICRTESSSSPRFRAVEPPESLTKLVSGLGDRNPLTVETESGEYEIGYGQKELPVAGDGPECDRFRNLPDPPSRLCIQSRTGSVVGEFCTTLAELKAGRAFSVQDRFEGSRAGEALIVGLVPDGIGSVQLSLRGKPLASIPVRNNVFSARYNGSAAVTPEISFQ